MLGVTHKRSRPRVKKGILIPEACAAMDVTRLVTFLCSALHLLLQWPLETAAEELG